MNLTDHLSDDLRRPEYRGNPNPLAGHCYIVAEAQYHRAKSLGYEAKSFFIRHEGQPHWYIGVDLKQGGGLWYFDPTESQFATPVPHDRGKGKGFLTKEPSKRAKELMRRAGWLG